MERAFEMALLEASLSVKTAKDEEKQRRHTHHRGWFT